MVPDSAAPNIYIYIYFLSVPLNFIQNDYAKANAGYVKGVENFKDVSHNLNSFLLSRLPLYFCSFFSQVQGLRFCAQTCAVCTVKKNKNIVAPFNEDSSASLIFRCSEGWVVHTSIAKCMFVRPYARISRYYFSSYMRVNLGWCNDDLHVSCRALARCSIWITWDLRKYWIFDDFSSFRCFVLICTGILCFSFPLILQDGECCDIGSENMHWIWSHILAICFRKPLERVEHAVGTCWKHVFRGWKYGSWTWPHFGNEPRAAETRWARCFLWPLDKIA